MSPWMSVLRKLELDGLTFQQVSSLKVLKKCVQYGSCRLSITGLVVARTLVLLGGLGRRILRLPRSLLGLRES